MFESIDPWSTKPQKRIILLRGFSDYQVQVKVQYLNGHRRSEGQKRSVVNNSQSIFNITQIICKMNYQNFFLVKVKNKNGPKMDGNLHFLE